LIHLRWTWKRLKKGDSKNSGDNSGMADELTVVSSIGATVVANSTAFFPYLTSTSDILLPRRNCLAAFMGAYSSLKSAPYSFISARTHTHFMCLSLQFVHTIGSFFESGTVRTGPCPLFALSSASMSDASSCFIFKSHFTRRCRQAPQAVNCCRFVFGPWALPEPAD